MTWRFIDAGRIDGYYSAALFESIAKHVGAGMADETILFWRVRTPVVYLGYHQYVEDEVHEDYCVANDIQVIRRVLGGGCGFCDENQILFSVIGREAGGVISPDIGNAYSRVLGGVVSALEALGCDGELEPARNAVYSGRRKISGNAQGRFDGAVLVNGSFLLDFDFDEMARVLKDPTKNLAADVLYARDGMITLSDLLGRRGYDICGVSEVLKMGFEDALGVTTVCGAPTDSEDLLASRLADRHRSRDWVYRMDDKRRKRLGRKRQVD
ncbi:MAG: biotin/lipoate A/B protein ligase family protein [Euryarchaeota archaeon]|nr:MAG: Lipoate-protein ligase A subunit 1 [ANME-2 cluster archaeon]MEA1865212.1 biotin/lipoate A/B protein ligase family protein [Euryarchaeota archaeon]